MSHKLCIHGHFYQPPRENPWMEVIFPEGSAAPSHNWNERIVRESYAPLAWARLLDGQGRIRELVNCYEWMSFNFGPTLISWMADNDPQTYERILDADRKSVERLGHGNAIAQIYHHVIMPLASDRDRVAEVAWAVDDFRSRFNRAPEGMWLSEAAVDTRTLEVLADFGIKYTILAPRQVDAVAEEGGEWRSVAEHEVDIRQPYRIDLGENRSIAVFFYDGPLSQSVAFEGLLADGEKFWNRIAGAGPGGLLSIATDGETYGHHFTFGEMALAYALVQGRDGRGDWELSNYGAFLASNPPRLRARLHENSSWSCVHGIERWRSDCGCHTGGHDGWNQKWREPLRTGLQEVKAKFDKHFDDRGGQLFENIDRAFYGFGRYLSGELDRDRFEAEYFREGITETDCETAWRLLNMQRWALSSLASCAWFFDDIARVEPRNAMTFALRAMELAKRTGIDDPKPEFLNHMARAQSNEENVGTGRDIWDRDVWARRETSESLVTQALLTLKARATIPAPGGQEVVCWPGMKVEVSIAGEKESGELTGQSRIIWNGDRYGESVSWRWDGHDDPEPFNSCITVRPAGHDEGESGIVMDCVSLYWKNRQAIALDWLERFTHHSWHCECATASESLSMFLEFRPYQHLPIAAAEWSRRWASLSRAYVLNGGGNDDLRDYLRTMGETHPEREILESQLGKDLLLLLDDPVDVVEVDIMLQRSVELGLSPDLWALQNRCWLLISEGTLKHCDCERIGFCSLVD